MSKEANEAAWAYDTNITDSNLQRMVEVDVAYESYCQSLIPNVTMYLQAPNLEEDYVRQLRLMKEGFGGAPLSQADQLELETIIAEMEGIYAAGKVCDSPTSCKYLDPDLGETMASSRDWDELLGAWKGWRDAVGPAIRPLYSKFVNISNKGARESGYTDSGAMWRTGYDPLSATDFASTVETLWQQVLPLYEQLHCYVRAKLGQHYGEDKVPQDDVIPAHILGNMWAQEWTNVFDLVRPSNKPWIDVTEKMREQGYNYTTMMRLSETFYKSLGFDPLPASFWTKSMFIRPPDRDVVCHASAWDLEDDDIRIKMCTKVTQEDLFTIHHEMGHLYYFHQYRTQPYIYRSGANDGFHEAIGDTVRLSVSTPQHLKEIGLINDIPNDNDSIINYQLAMALEKVAFLPFGYLIDQWRWKVFSGEITSANFTKAWWALRRKYQGIGPPVERTEDDFDPGAKYHVAANVPYMRYFLAHILQFQFHRGLCGMDPFDRRRPRTGDEGGDKKDTPLYQCSIYKNIDAGAKFMSMLGLGRSLQWPDALKVTTGQTEMDATAIADYFAPLHDWLLKQNAGRKCGWNKEGPPVRSAATSDSAGHGVGIAFLSIGVIAIAAGGSYLGFKAWRKRRAQADQYAHMQQLDGDEELALVK
eukprot:CAMPEP_0184649044 /NCGR_PEP_ID=MMETSP0308-20130426/6315_1 /TAXON_ID=38269 /ORGANISM="Gloeochaete witrockiana, Strain SAG 46.84" /LENGTH=643 /DNA_ID=CAMNT_0027081439 /DNA_START=252 /DNA_END=2183 /DNA_ORIENTATION=+